MDDREARIRENAVLFGRDATLVGILTAKDVESFDERLPAILLLNAGLIHRVGPNGIHVRLARRLAALGHVVFRFDLSGIGDSLARRDALPPRESMIGEVVQAMNCLEASRNIGSFVLFGICSGADLAFQAASADARVAAAIMVNGAALSEEDPVQSEEIIKRSAQGRYYRKKMFNPGSWMKLLSGKSDFRGLVGFLAAKLAAGMKRNTTDRCVGAADDWRAILERNAELFAIYSEGSLGYDVYRRRLEREIQDLLPTGRLTVDVVKDVDHTFTLLWSQEYLIESIERWASAPERRWKGRSIEAAGAISKRLKGEGLNGLGR